MVIKKIKKFIFAFAKNNIPIAVFLAFVGFTIILSLFGVVPSANDLLSMVLQKYEKYGLIALFVSTFVEGFMVVGMYYVGSLFIISATILADGDIFILSQLVLVVWSAISLISIANFTIGKYTKVYDRKFRSLPPEKTSWRKFIYFVHPTMIAYYSYSLGRAQKSYYSLMQVSINTFFSAVFFGFLITVIHKNTTNILTFIIMPLVFIILIAVSRFGESK